MGMRTKAETKDLAKFFFVGNVWSLSFTSRFNLISLSIFILVAEMIQRVAHGDGRDLDHSVERHVQFQNQEDSSRYRECREHYRNDDRGIWRREQDCTHEND